MGFFDALSSGLRAAGRFVGDVVTSPEFGALVAPIAQAGVQRIASEIFSPNSPRVRTGTIALPPGIAGPLGSGTLINRPPTIFTPPPGDAGLGLPFAGISVGGPGGLRIGVDTPERSTEPAPRSTEVSSMALPTLPGGAPVGGMSLARGGDALFRVSATGRATPRKLVMSLTPAGNPTYWRHVGAPIAFSGDRNLCRKLKKVGRQLSPGR